MRKALRIIAVIAIVVAVAALVVLGFIYFEDIVAKVKSVMRKIKEKDSFELDEFEI